MRVLIVEDDVELAEQLKAAVSAAGLVGDIEGDGRRAAFLGATENYDAVVLDLGLPGQDGISVLNHWREQGCAFPVLILTARSRWSDKLSGFGAGADDFLTKPVQVEEVPLRLRALMRRSHGHASTVLRVGRLALDTVHARFTLDSQMLSFTALEGRLLGYLMHRPGEIVSRSDINEHVYERDLDPDSNTLDVLIGRIRRKLDKGMIVTERGQGFRLVPGG